METTVLRSVLIEHAAVLILDCGHFAFVPRDDEEGLSFVGSTTDCQTCDPRGTLDS